VAASELIVELSNVEGGVWKGSTLARLRRANLGGEGGGGGGEEGITTEERAEMEKAGVYDRRRSAAPSKFKVRFFNRFIHRVRESEHFPKPAVVWLSFTVNAVC
jgi:hypothetical protein